MDFDFFPYDSNLLSLNARNMNLLSCFRITGSVKHISSVNTTESGQSTASDRGLIRPAFSPLFYMV